MQGFMVGLVAILLVVIAGATVIGVFMYVLREKHEHLEHYIPGAAGTPASLPPQEAAPAVTEAHSEVPAEDKVE